MSDSSSSSSQPLLSDRDYEQDRRDGALDKPIVRIAGMVLLVVLLAVFTIAGLVTRYDLYNKATSVTLGAGDSWSVSVQKSSVFSGVFCSEYSVQATSPQVSTSKGLDGPQPGGVFSIIALSAEASLANGQIHRYIHERGTLGAYALNQYFIYHVSPPAGYVQVSPCSNQTDVSVVNCTDEDDARRFINDGPNSGACSYGLTCNFTKCGGSQMDCSYLVKQIPNSQTLEPVILVVYRTSGHGTGGESVQIDFDVWGSTYQLDKKVASCDNATGSCILPVPMASSDIVLQIPVDTKMNPTHLEGNCISRVPIYICIFVGLPLAIVLVLGGCALCLRKTQASVIKATDQADRTREYRSLGRRQNELERSDFLRPNHERPPPPSYPEDGNIQSPASPDEETFFRGLGTKTK